MSISNLLSSNNLDLQAGSITVSTVNAANLQKNGQNVTYNNFDFVQSNSGTASIILPQAATSNDPTTFGVADTVFSATGGTYSMPLDDTYNTILKSMITISNINVSGLRSAVLGFQFQNASDDTWDIDIGNLPYQWNILEPTDSCTISLYYKLNAGHGFKAVRLLVAGENSTDLRFGGGSTTRQNYAVIECHYSL